jgi:hypothetical protein
MPFVARVKAAIGAAPRRRQQMKFMVSLITDGTLMDGMTPEQMRESGERMMEFMGEIESAGVLLHTDRLGPVSDARTLRRKSGKLIVTDGPFTETKEQIAGYMVLECKNLDEAVGWAERLPLSGGAVEVRSIADPQQAP